MWLKLIGNKNGHNQRPSGGKEARFLRFCLVGGAGFTADAAILLALVEGFALNPIFARAFSFGVAVVLTFELNRTWAFGTIRQHSLLAAFAAYLGVQGAGFLCNLVVYTLALLTLPSPFNAPLFCLAIASAVALIVNYTAAKRLVFGVRARRSPK